MHKNSPPPVPMAEAKMREIYFRMTLREWQEGFRVGLSHMTPLSQATWCGFALLILGIRLLSVWLDHYPMTWPPTQLPPHPSLSSIGLHTAVFLFGYMIGATLFALSSQLRTAQATPHFLVCRRWGLSSRTYWKNVNALLETDEHICFCQNSPLAIVVPKRAFANQEQYKAFYQTALQFWHKAKGIPLPLIPDTFGVWPPAPMAGRRDENAQE